MICDKCNIRPAKIHVVTMVNGEKTEQHLCEACAAQNPVFLNIPAINLQKLFPYFAAEQARQKSQTPPCPHCGWTIGEIEASGKLGCSGCYQHFRPYIGQILQNIHTSAAHKGKVPAKAGVHIVKKRRLENLKTELARAVMTENFEHAAELRDQIKSLEGGAQNV